MIALFCLFNFFYFFIFLQMRRVIQWTSTSTVLRMWPPCSSTCSSRSSFTPWYRSTFSTWVLGLSSHDISFLSHFYVEKWNWNHCVNVSSLHTRLFLQESKWIPAADQTSLLSTIIFLLSLISKGIQSITGNHFYTITFLTAVCTWSFPILPPVWAVSTKT